MTRKNAELASRLLRTAQISHSTYPSVEGGWRVQIWIANGAVTFTRLRDVRAHLATVLKSPASGGTNPQRDPHGIP